MKGDGGAIGLTENMAQLQRWMVSGPEVARVINEFESAQEQIKKDQSKGPDIRHYEQVRSQQNTFAKHVNAFCSVAEGHECVMIRTVDTDVVVIAISCFKKIEQIKELWIAFGVGNFFRYLSVHNIANECSWTPEVTWPFIFPCIHGL